jgi:ATP-dependent Clp protease protease subunit
MEEILTHHTGQDLERLRSDTDRDLILTAQQAVDYGLADVVLDSRKAVPA